MPTLWGVRTNNPVGLFLLPLSLIVAMVGALLFLPAFGSGQALGSPAVTLTPCNDPTLKAAACNGLVEVRVRDVIPIQEAHTNALVLVTKDGTVLPVFVDQPAAIAIAFRLAHRTPPHPLSQDLLDDVVSKLGGKVTEVRIGDIHDDTSESRIFITQNGHQIGFASRASDAVAVALTNGAHIYASKQLIAKDGITRKEIEDMRKQMGIGGSGPSDHPSDQGTSAPTPPASDENPPSQIKM